MTTGSAETNEPIARLAGRSIFGVNAAGYDTARSGYPQALYDRVAASCAPRPRILEIGAGTGLSTSGLLSLNPSAIVAVEPDAGMAEILAVKLAGKSADIVCAPFMDAEINGRFDLVACAAAFHWLEAAAALKRIRSLLAERGILALWWNSYFGHGQADPFGDRVSELLDGLAIPLPPSYRGRRHYAFDAELQRSISAAGGFQIVDEATFSAERPLTAQQARDLFATFSFVTLLPPDKREPLLDDLGALVDREFGGLAPSIHATALYVLR